MNNKWLPTASLKNLKIRAQMLQKIREFFAARNVLEVETPLLCHTSVTDPHIESIPALLTSTKKYYLQTSPEYAMKRLLAAGSGAIYQICKSFRKEEEGRFHNPEFTMLEWYRPDFDHHALMQETDELLQFTLNTKPAEKLSYKEVFQHYLGIDPHSALISELQQLARDKIEMGPHLREDDNVDTWLQVLMSHCIEPKLGLEQPCFIYDYPISQAALARIQNNTAARFEVYYQGIELANGFHELQNTNEQRNRFEKNLNEREKLNLPNIPIDEFLLQALSHGLPNCSGIALGVDRLVMLATNAHRISDVISFDIQNA